MELPDNYDPRLDHNAISRTYLSGLGLDTHNAVNGTSGGVLLRVSKVSKELNELALMNLFSQCGKPTIREIKRDNLKSYMEVYVEYRTMSEATSAIRRFNNKEPLYLQLSVVESQSQNNGEDFPGFNGSMPVPSMALALSTQDQIARSTEYVPAPIPEIYRVCRALLGQNLTEEFPLGRMYEQSMSLPNYRRVSGGRVYWMRPTNCFNNRETPAEAAMFSHLRDFRIARSKILHVSGEEPEMPDNSRKGECAFCQVLSNFYCDRCKEVFYCGLGCQAKDWQKHKLVCRKKDLGTTIERKNGSTDIKSNFGGNSDTMSSCENRRNMNESFTHEKGLRRPAEPNMYLRPSTRKTVPQNHNQKRYQSDSMSNASDTSSVKTITDDNDRKSDSSVKNSHYKKNNSNWKHHSKAPVSASKEASVTQSNKVDVTNKMERKYGQEPVEKAQPQPSEVSKLEEHKKPSSKKVEPSTKVEPRIEVKKRIEAGMVKNVIVAGVDSLTDFWVHCTDDQSALTDLVGQLKERISDNSPSLKRAVVDEWCCKKFEEDWTRARIVSTAPLEILYVDYGNSEPAKLDELKMLPADLSAQLPPFATYVHLASGLSANDGDQVIPMRFLSERKPGQWTVEKAQASEVSKLEEHKKPSSKKVEPSTKVEPRIEVKKRIEAGMVKNVIVAGVDSLTDFWVHCTDDQSALTDLVGQLKERISDNSPSLKRAVVDEWCCKKFEEDWTRARIVSTAPLEILYVDYGNSEPAKLDELKMLPADLSAQLPPFATYVHLASGLSANDGDQVIPMRFLSERKSGQWTVEKVQASEVSEVFNKDQAPVAARAISSPVPTTKSPYFTEGEIYEVIVQEVLDEKNVYVIKLDLKEDLDKLQVALNRKISDSSEHLEDITINKKCAAKYEGEWFRASVRNLEPLTVLYIDFGNEAVCKPADLMQLPQEFREMRLLTVRVRLSHSLTTQQVKALSSGPVKLRVAKKDGKYWLADFASVEQSTSNEGVAPEMPSKDKLLGGITPQQHKSRPEPNPELSLLSYEEDSRLNCYKKVIDAAKEGDLVYCEVTRVLSRNLLTCIMGNNGDQDVVNRIYTLDLGDPSDESYRPQINEMVGVYMENMDPVWRRGVVLSEKDGGYNLALVDFGQLVVSSNIKKLPDAYKGLPLLSVKLSLNSCVPYRVNTGQVLLVKVARKLADVNEWEGEVEDCSESNGKLSLGVGRLTSWKIEPDHMLELATQKLQSGDQVIITAFNDFNSLYVRPVTKQLKQLYQCLSQEVAAECINADNLGRNPFLGELVAVVWDRDGNLYRAQVQGKAEQKGCYKVFFVDHGNTDNIHISKMKSISNKLKSVPCGTIKVGLKDVEAQTLTPYAYQYGIEIAAKKDLLKIEFEDLKKVVLTKLSDNTVVNKDIRELLKPSWVRPSHVNTSLAIQSVPMFQDLPLPDREDRLQIGRTEKVLVAYVPPFETVTDGMIELTVCKANEKLLSLYTKILRNQMIDYISSQKNGKETNRYVPRKGELCICLGDGDTPMRAECVKILSGHTALLAYVDFGSQVEVNFNKIFKMTSDLMQLPAYATRCFANGFPESMTYEKVNSAKSELDISEAEIKRFDGEYYLIHIPELIARVI